MSKRTKLLLEQSELRERVNGLLAKDESTAEERTELDTFTKRLTEIEPELRAAITVEPDPDPVAGAQPTESPEDRELRRLMSRAEVGAVARAAFEGRSRVDGEMAELQQHYGVQPNQISVELLRGQGTLPEVRTSGQSSAPSGTGRDQHPIISAVFPESVAAFAGVAIPVVPVGEQLFPVLTTSATVRAPAGGDEAADSAAVFTPVNLVPKRLQSSVFFRIEDAAMFAGLEEALRRNLSDALSDALDAKAIAQFTVASGGLPDPAGPGAFATAFTYAGAVFNDVDGLHATRADQVRWLLRPEQYAHMGSAFATNTARAAAALVLESGGGLRVTPHLPAPTSDVATTIAVRSGPGFGQNMTAPVWRGITMIRDEVTQSKSGEIRLTAVMLYNVAILRAAGYQRRELQIA